MRIKRNECMWCYVETIFASLGNGLRRKRRENKCQVFWLMERWESLSQKQEIQGSSNLQESMCWFGFFWGGAVFVTRSGSCGWGNSIWQSEYKEFQSRLYLTCICNNIYAHKHTHTLLTVQMKTNEGVCNWLGKGVGIGLTNEFYWHFCEQIHYSSMLIWIQGTTLMSYEILWCPLLQKEMGIPLLCFMWAFM